MARAGDVATDARVALRRGVVARSDIRAQRLIRDVHELLQQARRTRIEARCAMDSQIQAFVEHDKDVAGRGTDVVSRKRVELLICPAEHNRSKGLCRSR